MDHPELDFFNSISGSLKIELSEPTQNIGNLDNQRATPEATILSMHLEPEIFEQDKGEFRPVTEEELGRVAFLGASIKLQGESGDVVEHHAPNGTSFTVRELLAAVVETERQTRGNSEWFGGIDVHHVFLEGIHPSEDDEDEDSDGDTGNGHAGVWQIFWGS